MQAPNASRCGFATLPFRLVNSAAYRFSISAHRIVCAFFTQRLFFLQIQAHRLLEIRKTDLTIAVPIHTCLQVQGFCTFFIVFLALMIAHFAEFCLILSSLQQLFWKHYIGEALREILPETLRPGFDTKTKTLALADGHGEESRWQKSGKLRAKALSAKIISIGLSLPAAFLLQQDEATGYYVGRIAPNLRRKNYCVRCGTILPDTVIWKHFPMTEGLARWRTV